MYQRILVPVDGSATSNRALQEAIRLASGQARLRLVHVIEDTYPLDAEGYAYIDYGALQEAVRDSGARALAKAREMAEQAGVAVETAQLEAGGARVETLIDADAQSWPADLIVVGTHGRSGLGRLLLGSVAEGVVRGASVPVLLVRAE